MLSKIEKIKEIKFQDGMFDHVDILQHLIFTAEKISQDAMAVDDVSDDNGLLQDFDEKGIDYNHHEHDTKIVD